MDAFPSAVQPGSDNMSGDCLFCRMGNGQIKPDTVYENDAVLAFRDINPQAPVHVLVIPKKHIASINDLEPNHDVLVGEMYLTAKKVAQQLGIAEGGYRTEMKSHSAAGQAVYQLTLHQLSGRRLG